MFFPEEIHRRTCVVVAARHFVGRARGRGRQHRATPPEASPESERKSRTLSPSNTRWPAPGWRGYDSVPKSIPSTFGHHLFAKGSRTGTPPRGRPPGNRSRGDPAVSRAETDILSTYMRGARDQQRGYTFGTPFRRVTTQETLLFVQKCHLFGRNSVGFAGIDGSSRSGTFGTPIEALLNVQTQKHDTFFFFGAFPRSKGEVERRRTPLHE